MHAPTSTTPSPAPSSPPWYKQAVIYQAHVRSFYDSDGDGIGDFRGLAEKLAYLQDLGVTALWLLPFYPSPLKDDGYDIADYVSVNPMYGTLDDFKAFLDEAHRRSLRVITELVVNHTSDQHAWFQRARRAPAGSPWRDFYVWSDDPSKYRDARIIFRDFETSNWAWDPVANAYYWHRFYSHQPDLNFDHPPVHDEIIHVLDFWLGLGVDGLRLDAVPYLYEREGTNCENLTETHAFLKKLRQHVDTHYSDRMLLAEANQWPEDAVAYFGEGRGDECHMAFHFPLMPRLFMAVRMEDRVPITDILQQTPPVPETCQWAVFLRNHDELTLEMVTEEERDYMYRMYASDTRARINLGIRRRLAPLLENDRRRIELLHALLLAMPGTPVIYYGDEIGMGDNIYLGDRNGVRTPMHWSADRNAGFSRANPQGLFLPIILDPEYHYEAVNVETAQRNPNSLLWWMRRILVLRRRMVALAQGTLRFLDPDNRKVLAFVREHGEHRLLVVANLSRYAQPVELDLGDHAGLRPIDVFGRTRFPVIGPSPYTLTLGPHGFYWLTLEAAKGAAGSAASGLRTLADLPPLSAPTWERLIQTAGSTQLDGVLSAYLPERRWFGSKTKDIKAVIVMDAIPVEAASDHAFVTLLSVEYMQSEPEVYCLPLAFRTGPEADALVREHPHAAIARVTETARGGREGLLFDATVDPGFARKILELVDRGQIRSGTDGELVPLATAGWARLARVPTSELEPKLSRAEQSNTNIIFGERLILKFVRQPQLGINPDLEISAFLSARDFPHVAPLAGALQHRRRGEVRTIGMLTGFVAKATDGWQLALDTLGRYFERVLALGAEGRSPDVPTGPLLELARAPATPEVSEAIGTYLESARMLAEPTALLHRCLGSSDERDFAPEPFTPHYQRSLYQSMRNLAVETFHLLRRRAASSPPELRPLVDNVLSLEEALIAHYKDLYQVRLDAARIRCHGDFHLGQVLYTGKDFIILDFEGEPARPVTTRRIKRSPLSDVAGMVRSFDYAAAVALSQQRERGLITSANREAASAWARYWQRWVSAAFLGRYLETMGASPLLPREPRQLQILFHAYLLDKTVYEVGYELNNRPQWLGVPLQQLVRLLHRPR